MYKGLIQLSRVLLIDKNLMMLKIREASSIVRSLPEKQDSQRMLKLRKNSLKLNGVKRNLVDRVNLCQSIQVSKKSALQKSVQQWLKRRFSPTR